MSAFSLSNFHPVRWLANGVTALFTWPLALALYLTNWQAPSEGESSVDITTSLDHSPETGYGYGLQEHDTNCLFGRYWW
jgi:hypothetical protein